jgi:hypothetical protein
MLCVGVRVAFSGGTAMRAIYCVLERDGWWTVRFNGRYFGACRSAQEATRIAKQVANKALNSGFDARVMVRRDGRYQTVWANGAEGRNTATSSSSRLQSIAV